MLRCIFSVELRVFFCYGSCYVYTAILDEENNCVDFCVSSDRCLECKSTFYWFIIFVVTSAYEYPVCSIRLWFRMHSLYTLCIFETSQSFPQIFLTLVSLHLLKPQDIFCRISRWWSLHFLRNYYFQIKLGQPISAFFLQIFLRFKIFSWLWYEVSKMWVYWCFVCIVVKIWHAGQTNLQMSRYLLKSDPCSEALCNIVVADWHELMIPLGINMWPSFARACKQLDPQCSQQTYYHLKQPRSAFAPSPVS